MSFNTKALIPLAALLSLAACAETPTAPTAQVLPGPGKDYTVFLQEQQFCRNQAAQAISGQAEHQNHRAIYGALATTALGAGLGAAAGGGAGAGIGAAAGALGGSGGGAYYSQNQQDGLQTQYNNTYVQCMIAYHNVLPGYAAQAPESAPVQRSHVKTRQPAKKAAATSGKKPDSTIELD